LGLDAQIATDLFEGDLHPPHSVSGLWEAYPSSCRSSRSDIVVGSQRQLMPPPGWQPLHC